MLRLLISIAFLAVATAPLAGADFIPVSDQMLVRFDRPVAELNKSHKFGIFREDAPRSSQSIEQKVIPVTAPGSRRFNYLKIHYVVSAPGTYNGWWLKLDGANWNGFSGGDLVLRSRLGAPGPLSFKLEIKSGENRRSHPYIVQITKKHVEAQRELGFFDLAIPLADILPKKELAAIHELVLVFENRRVKEKKGDFLLHSIRLSRARQLPPAAEADKLLDALAKSAFRWFAASRDKGTGLILDRYPNAVLVKNKPTTCSIASVGYYLSMLPEAIRTGLIEKDEAARHALQILDSLSVMKHHKGLYYHFYSVETREPLPCEVSTLDSAILMNGLMVISEAMKGDVEAKANSILDRVNWSSFLMKHSKTGKTLLSLGWKDNRLLSPIQVKSSEMSMPVILAVGAQKNPVGAEVWYNARAVYGKKSGYNLLNPTDPLFTSYYGLGWHDLRGMSDRDGVDLDKNARLAAMANRAFCRAAAQRNATYRQTLGGWWGISAGDSKQGYVAPSLIPGDADGTVWPTTSIAAITWIPDVVRKDISSWRKSALWDVAAGPYGLAPFNVSERWVGRDLIGIDVGSFYINYANHKAGTVRNLWMKHPIARRALERLEFRKR